MKHILLIATFLHISNSFSQAYLDSIALKSCNCLNELPDSLSNNEYTLRTGLCMMKASEPYSKKLKKDFGINFNEIDREGGEELGRIIGLKLITVCPEFIEKMTKVMSSDYAEDRINTSNDIIVQDDLSLPEIVEDTDADDMLEVEISEGVITKIENENFVVFSLKDESGKITKFYWLTFVEADIELSGNYQSLLEKNVEIGYVKKDFFDPKINEYRTFNVIFDIYEAIEEE